VEAAPLVKRENRESAQVLKAAGRVLDPFSLLNDPERFKKPLFNHRT